MAEYHSPLPEKVKPHGSRLPGFLIGVLFVGALLLGVLYRHAIVDQITVWSYRPPESIQAIAKNAKLAETGKFFFYASRPEIDNADSFNEHCQRREEHSAILGCYDGRQIYIYNVKDARLKGIQEVTAAHEMLHAAWDRLSDAERARLGQLLEAELQEHLTPELQERMAYYARTQPGERANELHSIIATEISDVSGELEQYYAKYFTDRKALVATHDAYSQVFKDLEDQANALYSEIEKIAQQITAQKSDYEAATVALEQENTALEQQYAAMDRSDDQQVAAYNERAAAYNQQLSELRAQYAAITQLIASHNEKVVQYNQITVTRQNLQDSIDSLKAPQ